MRSFPRSSLLLLALFACSTAQPEGVIGPDADALARRLEAAVGAEAWRRTGAVTWVFAGRNTHIWDRARGYALVESGDSRVLIDLDRRRGRAWTAGSELRGSDAHAAVDKGHASWINDSFWLNPAVKTFDDGVVRKLVPDYEGRGHALLVQYTSGGRTPGDAYLWILDANGRPTAWRMWTSVIPIGGVELSWERWVELETGAWISTLHATPIFDVELTALRGASDLFGLDLGEDPFLPLLECDSAPERCTEL